MKKNRRGTTHLDSETIKTIITAKILTRFEGINASSCSREICWCTFELLSGLTSGKGNTGTEHSDGTFTAGEAMRGDERLREK